MPSYQLLWFISFTAWLLYWLFPSLAPVKPTSYTLRAISQRGSFESVTPWFKRYSVKKRILYLEIKSYSQAWRSNRGQWNYCIGSLLGLSNQHFSWTCDYGCLWAIMCMLGIATRSSGRGTSFLNYWVIYLVPFYGSSNILNIIYLFCTYKSCYWSPQLKSFPSSLPLW